MPASYSELSPAPISDTIALLGERIRERFPGSGLSDVAAELSRVAERNHAVVQQLRRPVWWLRGLTALTIVMLATLVLWSGLLLIRIARGGDPTITELLQGIDAATNEFIVLSLMIIFLVSLETRLKRRTALRMLHQLRSIAHVGQLARYLDYCSELLALTGKLAALHAQHLQDPVVLESVNDIESLTADLSNKIWQKITILDIATADPRTAA